MSNTPEHDYECDLTEEQHLAIIESRNQKSRFNLHASCEGKKWCIFGDNECPRKILTD